jgi:hypothetical protein
MLNPVVPGPVRQGIFSRFGNRVLLAGLILLFVSGCLGSRQASLQDGAAAGQPQSMQSEAEAALGIKITSLRLSAEGYIVDLRYMTVDAAKAETLFSRQIKPYLMHEATGKVLAVPTPAKIGPLRQTTNKPVAGKGYFMLFGNAGKFMQSGDKVTLIFGEHRIEHLTVE